MGGRGPSIEVGRKAVLLGEGGRPGPAGWTAAQRPDTPSPEHRVGFNLGFTARQVGRGAPTQT